MRPAQEDRALFALLGVDETASWEDARRAFRAAVRANHPDLHPGDSRAERRLKALNAAWESINTPGKWADYILPRPVRSASGDPPGRRHRGPLPAVGRLRIQRQLRGAAGLYNWRLELDGTVIASIENGGTHVLDAAPGRHRLRVFYAAYSSLPLSVVLHRGQELHLGCRQLESLRTTLFSPKRALVLELLDSRSFA